MEVMSVPDARWWWHVVVQGQIIERGRHDELVAKQGGVYAHMWELQQSGTAENKEGDLTRGSGWNDEA
jgi:hypothetical protein